MIQAKSRQCAKPVLKVLFSLESITSVAGVTARLISIGDGEEYEIGF